MNFLNTQLTMRFLCLAACYLLLVWVVPIAAQTTDTRVKFFALPAEGDNPFTVGDQIILRLEVIHSADSQGVDFPRLGEQWGEFEVIGQNNSVPVNNGDGTITSSQNIIVALYEPGQYETEIVVVTHVKADGSTEELGAPVIQLTIESILVEGDTELRDLKPQAFLGVPPIWPWILAGFILFLFLTGLIAGTGLWLYNRRKQRVPISAVPLPVIDLRPPEVIAYAELDRIETLNLPAKRQYKMHYSLVADCLRRYIEGRYGIPALERTSTELLVSFGKSLVRAEDIRDFMDLFMESDLVKFARFRPSQQDAYWLMNKARAIIEVTTPEPEPVNEPLEAGLEPEVTA
jgi:hypothetical protein